MFKKIIPFNLFKIKKFEFARKRVIPDSSTGQMLLQKKLAFGYDKGVEYLNGLLV